MSAKDKLTKAIESVVLGNSERQRQELEAEIAKAQAEAAKKQEGEQ